MHFHGIDLRRPVPFYRIFKGNVFEQADKAVDFVMSKLNRGIGTRAESTQAPVHYEIPHDVIREAIVNAVAHRDYSSAGAVQVSVFTDLCRAMESRELTAIANNGEPPAPSRLDSAEPPDPARSFFSPAT